MSSMFSFILFNRYFGARLFSMMKTLQRKTDPIYANTEYVCDVLWKKTEKEKEVLGMKVGEWFAVLCMGSGKVCPTSCCWSRRPKAVKE